MRLNVSKLRVYRDCQLKGKWLYDMPRDQRDRHTSDASNRYGKAIHGVLEDVYGWAKSAAWSGPMHAPEPMARAFESIGRRSAEYELTAEHTVELEEAVIDYLSEQHHVMGTDILGVEQFVQFKTPAGNQVIGICDRVDRLNSSAGPLVRGVDYKGGHGRSMGPDEVAANMQAQTYIAALLQLYPWATRLQFRLEHLGSRTSVAHTWTRTEAAFMAQQVAGRYDEEARDIEVGPWLPNTGRHCGWCPFRGFCPAQDGARDGSDIPETFYNPQGPITPEQPSLL